MGYLDLEGLQYLWGKIKEKFAAKSHTHDDRYYTESEINTKLAGKSDTGHTHDDRYYTESEMDGKLAQKVHEETITTAIDLDTIKTTGIYHLKITSCTNHPYPVNHSTLVVEFSIGTPYQIVMIDCQNKAWRRNYNNSSSTWGGWTELKFTDTNTWRGIQDNLTSDSATDSLSAAQGKALKTLVDGKAASNHTHDDRYYTESEMNTKLAAKSDTTHSHDLSAMINKLSTGDSTPVDADYYVSQYVGGGTTTTSYHRRPMSALWNYIKGKADGVYLKLSGGTITGRIVRSNAGGNWISDRDRVTVFGNSFGQDAGQSYNAVVGQKTSNGAWTIGNLAGDERLIFNYTTDANYNAGTNNYTAVYLPAQAGTIITSATIGNQSVANATTATKLSTSAGSAARPVYFSDGKPVAGTYTLGNASSKTIRTLSTLGPSGWKDLSTDQGYVPDMAFMAYWNGAYSTSGASNLLYCSKGAFGTAATKNTGDFAAAEHTHGLNSSSLAMQVNNATTNSWDMVGGNGNNFLLRSLRMQANAPSWLENNYAAGIVFGGSDTKGVLSTAYDSPKIKIAGGNGSAPTWWLRLTGTSGKEYNLNEINNKLPTAGGTMSGNITFSSIGDTATSSKITWNGSTDGADIYYQTTASDQGNLVLNLRDDSNCYLRIASNGSFKSYFSPADGNFHGNVNGKADTAGTADKANSVAWSNVSGKPTIPDAAISASGSNYVRFSDGTQVCWGISNPASGSNAVFNFPVAFANTSYFCHSNFDNGAADSNACNYTTTSVKNRTAITSNGQSWRYIAIGRWK